MVLTIFLWLISWWNVENLFDTRHDSLKNDLEYTPTGARYWTHTRYNNKVHNLARVICNMGGWQQPLLVGLGEVENDYCLRSLCYTMVQYPYQSIHYESPDQRGIDVAALYDTTRFSLLHSKPLPVPLTLPNTTTSPTRDILYIEGILLATHDTLYIFFCHLPSMRSGAAASEWKRDRAKAVIQHHVDSIFTICPQAKILVMGDMNGSPQDDLKGLTNQMIALQHAGQGTHYYQGRWSCLDQCYLSPSLAPMVHVAIYRPSWMLVPSKDGMDSIPRRTYWGYRYDRGGYSDHLPIYVF